MQCLSATLPRTDCNGLPDSMNPHVWLRPRPVTDVQWGVENLLIEFSTTDSHLPNFIIKDGMDVNDYYRQLDILCKQVGTLNCYTDVFNIFSSTVLSFFDKENYNETTSGMLQLLYLLQLIVRNGGDRIDFGSSQVSLINVFDERTKQIW